MNKPSLQGWVMWLYENNNELPNPVMIAKYGDYLIKKEKYKLLKKVATDLEYDLLLRKDISDYKRRNKDIKRYRIGKYNYYLIPKSTITHNITA